MDNDYRIVLTTCPDQDTADKLAEVLVERRLAACVNCVPGLRSVYVWEGKTERSAEVLLLIKTRADRFAALEQAISTNHPYELPEIVSVSIDKGSPRYLAWIDSLVDKTE